MLAFPSMRVVINDFAITDVVFLAAEITIDIALTGVRVGGLGMLPLGAECFENFFGELGKYGAKILGLDKSCIRGWERGGCNDMLGGCVETGTSAGRVEAVW
jgi:hypothetical protein